MKNLKILFITMLLLISFSCEPEEAASALESLARIENWEINFTTLKVRDTNDENELFGGSHDEPAIIILWFQSKFFEASSTQVSVNRYKRTEQWSPDLEDQEIADIPPFVGKNTFQTIIQRTPDEIINGEKPDIIGAVIIALEHDNTSWSSIDGQIESIRIALKEQLVSLVENATITDLIDLQSLSDKVNIAINEVQSSIKTDCWEKLKIWLSSFSHTDDFIDVHFLAFVGIDDSNLDLSEYNTEKYQLNKLVNVNYSIGQNPITLRNNTAIYELEGFIQKE